MAYTARPGYTPLATQQQMAMQQPNGQPLTYEQWLAARGMGPSQQAPQQQAPAKEAVTGGLLKKLFGSGAGAGAGQALSNIGGMGGAGAAGETGLASGAGAAGEVGAAGMGSLAVPAAVAAATILGGRYGLRALQGKTKNWKDASLADNAGRVITGVATGGLSEVANKFLGHKSTRDVQAGVTSDLMSQFKDDPQYQNFVAGMRKQFESGPPDPSKPFAGKYGSWDEYKKAGLEAGDLTGTEGAIRAGGAEYTKLPFEQQKAFVQALIEADQLNSEKGGVNVRDLGKSQQIFQDMKSQGFRIPQATTGVPRGGAPMTPLKPILWLNKPQEQQPTMIPQARSQTRSPGIDLNGNRINYGRR